MQIASKRGGMQDAPNHRIQIGTGNSGWESAEPCVLLETGKSQAGGQRSAWWAGVQGQLPTIIGDCRVAREATEASLWSAPAQQGPLLGSKVSVPPRQ